MERERRKQRKKERKKERGSKRKEKEKRCRESVVERERGKKIKRD